MVKINSVLDTLSTFASFIVFEPRHSDNGRSTNYVNSVEQVTSLGSGQYERIHEWRPGISDGLMGVNQLTYIMKSLKNLAPRKLG